jgi:GT2 family glycosyltransferase
LDTGSREEATKNFYAGLKDNAKVRVIDYPKLEFNFAEANTWAVQYAKGDYLLFLNNDTEVINTDWLSSMMEFALLENVGIVGPKLLFPNGTIQHMGVVIGLREGASHAGVLHPDGQRMGHPFLHAKDVTREVSAVTGACLLIRKNIFNKAGGFDKSFKIAFNDIDLCLKVGGMGLHVVYTPYAKLIHHESITFGRPYDDPNRSSDFFEKERALFRERWNLDGFSDPFYNKNLTLKDESLGLKI